MGLLDFNAAVQWQNKNGGFQKTQMGVKHQLLTFSMTFNGNLSI